MLPKIYLLDRNKAMTDAWKKDFAGCEGVEIHHMDFKDFMDTHPSADGVVSPANSMGLMDGGYDKAISDYFSRDLHEAVQKELIRVHFGEQPVGSCMTVKIPHTDKLLLHTPSMRTPEVIIDPRVIYTCTRSTLVAAMQNNVKEVVMPAFGGLTGRLPVDVISQFMRLAYDDILDRIDDQRFNTWRNIFYINH